jgi:hypothetical protein
MTLPKTTPAKDDTTPVKDDTTPAKDDTTPAKDDTTPAKDDTTPVNIGQVLSDFMASMREVQESVRADRERIEELQLANGLVIRQGAPDNTPPTAPPDDSYIDPAQFDPSNMDFKI